MSLTRFVCLAGLSSSLRVAAPLRASETPAAANMPPGWRVIRDESFSAQDFEPIPRRLGGDIATLGNTVYEVRGTRVQLNLIVARDEANAARIVDSLHSMTSKEFVLRKGLTVHEFVGNNEAIPEMKAGQVHLERSEPADSSRKDSSRASH